MDGWTDDLVPPANSALPPPTNSTVTLHVASQKAIWTGFDGAYGPRTQSDGDFGRGPLLLIANNSNPGRALHCLVFEKDTASYCHPNHNTGIARPRMIRIWRRQERIGSGGQVTAKHARGRRTHQKMFPVLSSIKRSKDGRSATRAPAMNLSCSTTREPILLCWHLP